MDIDGLGFSRLNQVMNVLLAQHRAVAQNVANVNTPGYIRRTVEFDQALTMALETPESASPTSGVRAGWFPVDGEAAGSLDTVADESRPARTDGNNVDLETEVAALNQLNQGYASLTRILSKEIRLARYVISEGRR